MPDSLVQLYSFPFVSVILSCLAFERQGRGARREGRADGGRAANGEQQQQAAAGHALGHADTPVHNGRSGLRARSARSRRSRGEPSGTAKRCSAETTSAPRRTVSRGVDVAAPAPRESPVSPLALSLLSARRRCPPRVSSTPAATPGTPASATATASSSRCTGCRAPSRTSSATTLETGKARRRDAVGIRERIWGERVRCRAIV